MASSIPHTGKARIRALLTILNAAAEEAISEYHSLGFDVPSTKTVEPHPFDGALPSLKNKNAIRTLEGTCAQLCATLAQPAHTMLNYSMGAFVPTCIDVVIKAGIAEHLAEHPDGLNLGDLAKKTGICPEKIGTVMRLLVVHRCFQEVKSNVFAHNRLSLTLVSNLHPPNHNHNQIVDAIDLKCGEMHKLASLSLYDALVDPVFGPTYDKERSPLMFALKKGGYEGTFYEYIQTRPNGVERFANAMGGFRTATGHMSLLREFPWKDIPPQTTVCDLGGGIGNISIELAREFGQLRIVLQDLGGTLAEAKKE